MPGTVGSHQLPPFFHLQDGKARRPGVEMLWLKVTVFICIEVRIRNLKSEPLCVALLPVLSN